MSNTNLPSETPNVVLANPYVRKALNYVVGGAALLLPIAAIIDGSSDAIDWSAFTIPATGVTSFLAGLLGLAVTVPNIPTR
jgi:peptidoglycan/LPS O-acetylase OafA/YrhL